MLTLLRLPAISNKYLLTCMPEKSSYRPVSVLENKSICLSSTHRIGDYVLLSQFCICFCDTKPVMQFRCSFLQLNQSFKNYHSLFYIKKLRESTLFRSKATIQFRSAIKLPLVSMFMDRFSDIFWHHKTVFVYLNYETRQSISVSQQRGKTAKLQEGICS